MIVDERGEGIDDELAEAGLQVLWMDPAVADGRLRDGVEITLCVLDHDLPGGSGPALLQAITRARRDVPVVACTSTTSARAAIRLFRMGAADVVLKPINGVELAQVLLRVARARRELLAELAARPVGPALASVDAGDRTPTNPPPRPASRPTAPYAITRPRWASPEGVADMPPLNARVMELAAATENLGNSASDVIRFAEDDPILASRVIRVANTVWYRGPRPYTNIRDACVRLGNRQTLGIFLEALYRESFTPAHPALRAILDRFQRCTVFGARVARHLASQSQLPKAEEIYAAALLHNIGELVLLWRFGASVAPMEAVSGERIDEAAWFVDQYHEEVGGAAARSQSLPPLATILAQHHHTARPREGDYDRTIRLMVLAGWACAREVVGPYLPTRHPVDANALLDALGVPEATRRHLQTLLREAAEEER